MFFIHWRLQGTEIFYHEQISHENIQPHEVFIAFIVKVHIVKIFNNLVNNANKEWNHSN